MLTLRHSLRALSHPFTLVSLAVLLLNDHVLKQVTPSPLTGKLSDFAGLFFFPFLLAAGLAWLRLSPRGVMWLSVIVTGMVFTTIKIWPAANEAMESALTGLTGRPAQIVLDPTDLVALVMVWPAWVLWRKLEARPTANPPRRWEFGVVGIATLATLATSCIPPEGVLRVLAEGDTLYAAYGYQPEFASILLSEDGGHTWQYAREEVAAPIKDALSAQSAGDLGQAVCDPANANVCYRRGSETVILATDDGGQSWQVAWAAGPTRPDLARRAADSGTFCPEPTGAVSVSNLVGRNRPDGFSVIAAAGNAGIVVLGPDGRWTPWPVLRAVPFAYGASNLVEAFNWTKQDLMLYLAVALLLWVGVAGWGGWLLAGRSAWRRWFNAGVMLAALALAGLWLASAAVIIHAEGVWHTGLTAFQSSLDTVPEVLAVLVAALTRFMIMGLIDFLPLSLIAWAVPVSFVLAVFRLWQIAGRRADMSVAARRAAGAGLWMMVLVWLLPYFVIWLWVFGVIADYALAWYAALAVLVVIAFAGFRRVARLSRDAVVE